MVQSTSLWSFSTSSALASTAVAAATPPTAADFTAWSASAQAAYVKANSTDDPPFLVIGDPGEPQVLATLSLDGRSVVTADVPSSYSQALSTGTQPSSDDFTAWDPELQLAYLRAEGIDASSSLVLGDAGGAQLVATLNWNGSGVVTTPVPQSYDIDVASGTAPAAADFRSWPQALQLSYLQANGTGTPPSLVVGDPKDAQILATASADGRSVVTSTVPQSYSAAVLTGAAPAGSAAVGWPVQLQLSYLRTVSTDDPPFLIIGAPGGSQTLATLSADGASVVTSAVPTTYSTAMSTGAPPAASAAGTWAPELQLDFLREGSRDVPPFLVAADATGTPSLLTLAQGSGGGTVLSSQPVPSDYAAAMAGTAPPSPGDFGGTAAAWPQALQLSYLRAPGNGTPPSAVIGATDPNGVLVTLSADGTSAVATALPQSYKDALSGATAPTVDVFQGWAPPLQLKYLQQKGSGTPQSLTFGSGQQVYTASVTAGGAAVAVVKGTTGSPSYWGTTTSAPSAATVQAQAQATTFDLFSSWPLASQVAYLQAQGSGSPPSLLLPTADGTGQVLVSLAPGSNTVQFTAAPADFLANLAAQPAAGAATDTATIQELQGWPNVLQTYYVANKGAGSPPSLVLSGATSTGNNGSAVATLSSDGTSVGFTATSDRTALDKKIVALTTPIYPSIFFNLTPDEQAAYYQSCYNAKVAAIAQNGGTLPAGTTPPYVLDLYGSSQGSTIADIAVAGQTIQVALPTEDWSNPGSDPFNQSFYPLQAQYGAFASGDVDASTFAAWPPQVQSAYVAANAQPGTGVYPKTLVLAGGDAVATISAAGAAVDTVTAAGLGAAIQAGPSSLTPQAFLSWPTAGQLAFMRSQGGSVTLGQPPNEVTVTPNADGSGFVLAMADSPTSAQGVDFPLWSKVAAPLVQAKLLATLGTLSGVPANDTAPPPLLVTKVVSGPNAGQPIVVSGATAATGQGLTIEPLPSDFDTRPAALAPSAFLAWSPAVRQAYVQGQVSAAALPGTLDANNDARPPFVVGSGATALSITFSPADGTLQIGIPQTLAGAAASGPSAASTPLASTLLPYNFLPGSAVGTSSAINDAVAGALFPVLDGSGGAHDIAMSAQQAQDFQNQPSTLSGTTFAGWPSALQLQYLRVWQQPGQPLTIGTGTDQIDVLMQTTAQAGAVPKVYIVQNLQKADIGSMSFADQATLAKSAAFQTLASGLGLIPDCATAAAMTSGTTAPLAGSVGTVNGVTIGGDVPDPNAGLTSAASAAALSSAGVTLSAFGFVQQMFVTALNTIDHPTQVAGQPAPPQGPLGTDTMPAADRQVFENEVNLLRRQTFGSPLPTSQANQTAGLAVFSPKDIQDKLTAIIQRFTRANAFSSIANASGSAGSFQIVGFTGTEGSNTEYVYNPSISSTGNVGLQDLWDNLGYYEFDPNPYRVSNDDANGSALATAIGSALQSLPSPLTPGVPQTLGNLSIKIATTNTKDQNSSGANLAGDSEVINTITLQKVDPNSTTLPQALQDIIKNTASPLSTGRINQYGYYQDSSGAWYEIKSMTGSVINASSGTATPMCAISNNTESGTRNYSFGSFESTYGFTDNGQNLISQIPNDASLRDGAYHTINLQVPLTGGGYTFNTAQVIVRYVPAAASTDNNATIDSGYQTFMAQEKSILDLANRADQLANSGKIGGTQQNLDVPNLIYLFMMYTNLTGEANLRADTEEVNQTNAVLNEYAIMQKIINQTVAAITPGDDGKPGYGALKGSNPDGSFTTADQGALAMFTRGQVVGNGTAGAVNPPLSPIELLQTGFTRPYLTNGVGANASSSQWSSDGTSLSDAVTQLNQASQLKMNDIDSETKQKDREFDLANTALQQAQTVLNQIASTTSS